MELKRVVERWQQLPLDRALSHAPRLRALVQALADGGAGCRGRAPALVPDLGPAVLGHQLEVMVFDLFDGSAAAPPSAADAPPDPSVVAAELAGIRRAL